MWEITLLGEYEDVIYLLDLENTLKESLGKDVVVAIWINGEVTVSIATNNKTSIEVIQRSIIDTIIKISKNAYFSENLHISIDDTDLKTFLISSLIMVDIDEEVNTIYDRECVSNYINIKSFNLFKLSDLKSKWQFLIDYIHNTLYISNKDNIYLDFLKFLCDIQTPRHDILYLEKDEKTLSLIDNKQTRVKEVPLGDEIGVVVSLIMLSPKRIVIKGMDNLSNKVNNLVNYIFDEKVSYLL